GKSVLGVAVIGAGLGVTGAICGYLVGTVSSLAYSVFAVRRRLAPGGPPLRLDMRRLWQSTQGIAMMQVCVIVLSFSDIVVVKHFFAPLEAGIYSAVALTGKVLLFLVGFVPLLVLPRAAARTAQGRGSIDVIVVAAAFLLAASGIVLLVFAARPLLVVRVMTGDAYLAAAPYILTYGIAMTLLSATQVLATFNAGLHRFGFVLPLGAVALAEVAGLILVPHHAPDVVRVLEIGNVCALAATALPYVSERIFSRFASIAGH
ncbi:MAG: hypothetical protein JOY59_01535, partial [Candidatus Eremiobacteraeota bacterium]|nr:hypothetical protein [Candidatus Eremiobacteraeota bacterium]